MGTEAREEWEMLEPLGKGIDQLRAREAIRLVPPLILASYRCGAKVSRSKDARELISV